MPDHPFVLNRGKGPVITSASTITPTHYLHHVSGLSAISNITIPTNAPDGELLILLFDGLASLLVGGNIARPFTVAGAGDKVVLTLDRDLAKWY
jgi:hypothetical protein